MARSGQKLKIWPGRVWAAFKRLRSGRPLAVALLAALTCLRIADPLPIEALRLRVFDAYQVLRPRPSTAHPVAIADIDERSIAALGQWPWPRTRIAELVTKLKSLGAVAVGFDIVFAEPDRMSPGRLASELPDLDVSTRARLSALPSNDDLLAAALRQIPSVVGTTALDTPTNTSLDGPITGFATMGPDAASFVRHYRGLLGNVPVIERAAAGRGLFTIAPERDGIVRRVPMVLEANGHLAPSLSLELLRVLTGSGAILVRTDRDGVEGVALPHFALPTDAQGQVWVHFNAHDPRRFASIVDILSGQAPRERIAGKVVLVGTSAIGLLDNKTTPVERSMPGVEIHAQVLESALAGTMLHQPRDALAIELLTTLVVVGAVIVVAPLLGPVWLLLFGAGLSIALAGYSWWRFRTAGELFDATFPLFASFVVYLALAFTNYARESVARRRIRSAFRQYLSPDLVEELCRSEDKLALGGETRNMSVMFSDMRGFTPVAESFKHDPQGLTTLMNRLLTPLSAAIVENRGTVDKYMGDAVMAFWNAPLHDDEHELHACRAALDMLGRLDALNEQRQAEVQGSPKLEIGIGINTGECVVGNMGSDLRFDYSVLGDSVNLASRLEGQSKTYGVKIILGDETAQAVRLTFAALELDLLQVKGKSEPLPVWALVGDEGVRQSPEFGEHADHHARMLACYRERDLTRAAVHLGFCQRQASAFGLELLYDLYATRIAEARRSERSEPWSAVHIAVSK